MGNPDGDVSVSGRTRLCGSRGGDSRFPTSHPSSDGSKVSYIPLRSATETPVGWGASSSGVVREQVDRPHKGSIPPLTPTKSILAVPRGLHRGCCNTRMHDCSIQFAGANSFSLSSEAERDPVKVDVGISKFPGGASQALSRGRANDAPGVSGSSP